MIQKIFHNKIAPIINLIIDIRKIYSELNIDMLVFTGEFSDSSIFQKEIKNNFNNFSILMSPGDSIVKGAILYGYRN